MSKYISLSALLLVSACTVAPDYAEPAAIGSTHYDTRAESQLAAGPQRIKLGEKAAGDWWSAFNSPKLSLVMGQAIDGNLDLVAADARIRQAMNEVRAAKGGLYPQVDFGAQLSRSRSAAAPQPLTSSLYALGPVVSFDLDIFGGTKRLVEQQQALADLQKHRSDAAYLTLTGQVASQAIQMGAARAQIAAVQILLDDDRRNLDLIRLAHQRGSVAQTDVALAESQLSQDQTLLPPLAQQRDAARHALAVLAGKGPDDMAVPDFDLTDFALPSDLPVSLPSELAHDRPDILEAEAQLHAASAAVGVATANLYPHLVLSGSFTQAAAGPGSFFDAGSALWSIGAGLAGPVFHGGSLDAERRAAIDGYDASLADYRNTVVKSLGQVADVLQAINHDAEQASAQDHALNAAEASLRLARAGYQAGEIDVLQVLDAERAYQRALLGQIGAQTAQCLDTAQLSVALGGTHFPSSN
jgi:NodT family efflux transporter outer membrane factor (OMF) lipoprotein